MRIINQLLLLLIALLAISVWIPLLVEAKLKSTKAEPYSPCTAGPDSRCTQQGLLCCRWRPPGSNAIAQQCYSTSAYTCIKDNGSNAACLCPAGYQCCNLACYRTTTHTCAVNENRSPSANPFQLCPFGYRACNGACYLSNQYYCCPGGYLSNTGAGGC